jgi:hypothetical protein
LLILTVLDELGFGDGEGGGGSYGGGAGEKGGLVGHQGCFYFIDEEKDGDYDDWKSYPTAYESCDCVF